MEYKKIKSYNYTEEEMRKMWEGEYCNVANPIYTFDKVLVIFYANMFNHIFFESANRAARDKSVLSLNRLKKMLWIKAVLQDPDAILKKGWDRDNKSYYEDRRVAMIRNNYVVIIRFTGILKATLVTAYELTEDGSASKILASPDWEKTEEYFREDMP